ncbi:transport and Golgi organization protein 1 homolog isoform X1 [Syngnathus acus]|uniref:transport and Golgi organization protein 1 homolog isoform X1 n=1 Tax=Syngnathus acus TaxID=161584 RepID=UPI001885C4BB|nr:transport and Golgi organization protein 1 homolog isoform X1 [Syngnathus acus]
MPLSHLSIILWSTSVFFVFWPQLSRGLLSDLKLCGDPKCYSQMSRVRAVRDHDGKDCRFLSFRQGESIFVHHKLTGKRSNLWSGSINQRSGYFPKEAVKEEQKIATEEIVIATQESDFLCMDNLGYPIDSSHLNADDDEEEEEGEEVENKDSRLKSPLEDLDSSETNNYNEDTNARTPTMKDSSLESHSASREEIENEDNGGAETKAKSPESAVELKEKGGSPASSWLRSSVTGWLGGGKQEEPDSSAEVQKHLMPGQDLLPSSLTGWLGLTSEANSVSATNQGEQDRKAVESGWLGFGGEENVNEDDERQPDLKPESGENFRSRKMYLDLETQPIQEKKGHNVGTLGWLGNGLSQTLGFGPYDPDTSQTIQGEVEKDGKQTESASWFDLGIRNILALGEDDKVGGDVTDSDAKSDHRVPSDHGKDSHFDDTSQVDQKGDPNPQNQRTDKNHGNEERQNNLANKDDVTSMLNAPCNDEATLPDLTKQGDNVDKSNISSDEEGKREKDTMMEQRVGQESGSSPPSKREIRQDSEQDDSQGNDKKSQEDHQEDIDEEELKGKRQDRLKSVTQENVTDDNKQEEEQGSPLELVSEHLRDAQIIHQKLSEEEKGKRSSPDMEGPYLQSSFRSAFNFLKERSFVSSLGPNKEEDTSNRDKYKEFDEEEKMDQVKTIEEEEASPALIEKPEEIVQGYHKHKEEHESSEKLKISEKSQFESPQEFRVMEQIHEKKLPESIENHQQDHEEEESKLRKKEGVHNLMQEEENADQFEDDEQKGSKKLLEVDDESDEEKKQETFSDLKQSVFEEQHKPKTREEMDDEKHEQLKGKEDDLEDEKQEELERGPKSEVAEVSVQTMQEEDQEEAFQERQKQHEMEKLAGNEYQVGDEGGEELDKEQEQLEKLDEKNEEDGLEEKENSAPEDIEQDLSFHLTHQTHLHEKDAQTTLVETESHEKTVNGACVKKNNDDSQRTIKELTDSPSGFDGKPNDMSKTQTPQSPQHQVDSTTKSDKNLHPPPWNLPSDSLNTAEPHQPTPSETLQDHMSTEETTILAELLGQKKLEHLNDIFGHADQDHDESISSDIETILHEHRERLYAPSVRLWEAPEEDKVKTRTLIAIQKLEILLKRARDTFHTRKSELNRINAQAQTSCVGACRKDQETMKTVAMQIEDATQKQSSSPTRATDFVKWPQMKVVSLLPHDIRPGPDFYGIPWELIIISSLVGLVTMLLFSCRCYSSVKSRLYRRKEWWMAEQVAKLVEEKCEVLETLSKCQQEYDELENSLSESGAVAQTQKADLEVRARQLELNSSQLEESLQKVKDQLDQQRAHRLEQEQKVTLLEQSMEAMELEAKELQSQEQQAQTTIKVYNMNSERLQKNMETSGEENTLLKESNAQLRQQVEGWAERVSELEEEMRRYELTHSGMVQDVANRDERIKSLTDRLLGMKAWDANLEGDGGDTSAGAERNGKVDAPNSEVHLQKVQKLIFAAKLNADLKSVDEDKDRVFAKLNDEVKAKEDLEVSIKELESERFSMQADTEHYSEQVQRLQQKLQIMTEMYQENELKLHRLLTVEEKERLQKEDKLTKADKNIALAMEELNNYKLRAGEMEEELGKTKQSYQTQISAHEKKAHNNWLAARAADRELSDTKRENALLRQKITDTQFKMDTLDKDPFTLDSLARPLPFRAERLPYGPSPLGRPASENRALLSPPTLVEGPLSRLSPRVSRGPIDPHSGQGEQEQSGAAHSDSGSLSPSWERDRRGPPPGPPGPFPHQGYMYPEPGGPIYRRPAGPPPGVMGPLPPPGLHPRGLPSSGPLGPIHPADTTDGTNRENSLGPEYDHREPGPGDGRTPPEPALRMGMPPPPPPGPPMGPIDGPFPRRAPFGPPEFFPPRGPPMMPMWAPRPGMMFPPRYPHGGPPPPHPLSYGPPMRPPPPDGLPPPSMAPPTSQQNLPFVPQSEDEQTSVP